MFFLEQAKGRSNHVCLLMARHVVRCDAAICPELGSKRTRNRWPHSVAVDPTRTPNVRRSIRYNFNLKQGPIS